MSFDDEFWSAMGKKKKKQGATSNGGSLSLRTSSDEDDFDSLFWSEMEEFQKQIEENRIKREAEEKKKETEKKLQAMMGYDPDEEEEEELSFNDKRRLRQLGLHTGETYESFDDVKNNDDRTWFQKGAFEDGWQFGDVTKTLSATGEDLRGDLIEGVLGIGEGVIDFGATLLGGAGKLFGADNFAEDVQGFVEKDIINEEKISKNILGVTNPLGELHFGGVDELESSSVLGDKSDSLAQSAGQLIGTKAAQGAKVAWWLVSGMTSFGGEAENAFKQGADYGEAIASATISAGAEVLSEKLFGGSGLGEKGLFNTEALTSGISNKLVRTLAAYGIDVVGEGAEEVVSQIASNLGSALYREENLEEILLSEEALDGYLESFIGGAVLGGGANAIKAGGSIKNKTDYHTGLNANEEAVVNREVEKRIEQAEKDGKKLTKKDKAEIYEDVMQGLDKGYISIDTIEEVLGGDTYKSYQDTVKSEDSLVEQEKTMRDEFNTLNRMKKSDMTGEQSDRLEELRTQLSDLTTKIEDTKKTSQRDWLQRKYRSEAEEIARGSRLVESYNERARRGQAFEADLSRYDEKQKSVVQRAIDSGILNNTNRTHEFVDIVSKISADKSVLFDFTNNERLKESGFAIEGKGVNGYITKDGIVLNVDSPKAWQTTVGHEITHVLEGTELYTELQNALFDYAKTKGDYQGRLDTLTKLYEGVKDADVNAELTADLVGDYLFTDADFVNHLSTKNRNVFQKIYDEIKYLVKVATAGTKEAKELEKVKHAFEKAYKAQSETQADTKYSLTAEQQEYFKDSVVRDENGNLKVMYHGTSDGGFTVFDTYGSKYGLFGQGSYFTDNKDIGQSYTNKGRGNNPQVYESYLNITNPIDMDAQADPAAWQKAFPDASFPESGTNEDFYRAMEDYFEDDGFLKYEASEMAVGALEDMGYDGITHVGGGRRNGTNSTSHQVYIAFHPEQIKDIGNQSPTSDPDIRYSLSPVEAVEPTSDKWQRTYTTEEAMKVFPNMWNVAAEESEVRNPTQIRSTVNTYRNIYNILQSEGFTGTILDASSGLGDGTRAGIEEYGFDVEDIEPYPDSGYTPKYQDYSALDKKYDVIISNAVLNVLPQDQRDALVVKMGELLNDGGRMFINVRGNDVESLAKTGKNIHLGTREWIETVKGSYQKGFTKDELKAYLEDALGDGYTVEKSNKFGGVSVVVTKDGVQYSLSESDQEADTYSRIYDMQVEVNQLTHSIHEFEETAEFKTAMDALGEAINSGDIDNGVKAYQKWRVDSGYDEMVSRRDSLRVELENLRKEFNEGIANKAVEQEKAAIARSGLSEAEYFRKQAVKEFGYTPYFYDAGYITPNGKMLNFSGEKGKHYGTRGQDHRAIGTIYAESEGTDALNRFVRDGNIRIMAESPGLDMSTIAEPTKEQYATIRKFVSEYAGKEYFSVDFTDESGKVIGSLTYENRINPTRIVNDIKHYYETGEIRQPSDLERFRYSLSDSDGRELTKEQAGFFKDSKIVDENGNLRVMYHGTPNGEFTVFRDGTYFTANKEYADKYQNPSASSLNSRKVATSPKTFEVYLNITKPFDINDPEARSIYINDYIKGGNAIGINPYLSDAEYDKISSIDWTEGEDLREFLVENGYDYDGLVLDEGAVGGYGEDVEYRGTSYVVFSPEQVKSVDNQNPTSDPDIRYSLSEEADGEYLSAVESGDMETAQRMVDEAAKTAMPNSKIVNSDGSLKKVYHGSVNEFNEFDFGRLGNTGHQEGFGFYFADTKTITKHYGNSREFYLDMQKPMYSDKLTITKRDLMKFIKALDPDGNGVISGYEDAGYVGYTTALRRTAETILEYNDNDQDVIFEVANTDGSNYTADAFIEFAKKLKDVLGYDGLISKWPAGEVYVVFDNKQMKFADAITKDDNGAIIPLSQRFNANETDLRRSLSDVGEAPQGRSGYSVYGNNVPLRDLRLETLKEDVSSFAAPMQEDIAPVEMAEEPVTETEQDMFPDDYAPMSEDDGATEERLASLNESDMPPEMEPYYGEDDASAPADPFEDRDIGEVGNRKVKAYMYENPEVKPFFQEEANIMLGELNDTVKGERIYSEEGGWMGTSRYTSDDIAYLRDSLGYTYAEIEKGLNAIIEDNGAENNAISKRIEFILNDRLADGYTDFRTGMGIPANQEYINLLNEKQITDYSRGAWDNFVAEADQYAPPMEEDIGPVMESAQEVAPAREATEDIAPVAEEYEAITPPKKPKPKKKKYGNKLVRADNVTPEQQKIAEILDAEPGTTSRKSRAWAKVKANFLDKGAVFEDLALKTKNRELMGKWNYMLYSEARAQRLMGNGAEGVKSLNSIIEEVGKTGKTKQFYEYLYHQHNADRMTLAERYEDVPNKAVFGDSVTAEVSREAVAQMEQANPEFKQWAQDVYDYNNYLRSLLVEGGVISQETADLWAEMYPHFVPIRRAGDKGLAVNVPLDTGRTTVNAPVKRATGGNSDILPLFDTMAMRTVQTFKAIAKNSFGVELKNSLGTTIESEATGVDDVIDSIDQQDGLLKKGENGRNPTFTVFENGEKVTYEITEDMYDALKPTSEGLAYTNTVLNTVSNIHRGVLTEYNPVFMLTNAIKDIQDVFINSQHSAKTYAKIPEAYAQLAKKGYWYQEYMANGGEQNSYFDNETHTFRTENKGIKRLLDIPPLSTISKINNFIEMAPRLAEYIASREAGRSVEVSMLDAARVTTNFRAGGDITKFLNRNGATFLNASVQGAMQQVRNVREANANGLKGWVNLATKFALAGLPALLLNGLIWEDDEEYEELSDYVKQNYYIVGKYGDGKFIRIPKGRTMAVIQNAFEQISNAATGDDEVDLKAFLELAVSNLAPNNPIENNILSPIIQVANNETWYGEDLVPTRLQDLPAEEQFDESTDAISKWLGEKLNISPYKINYLLDQYTGGVGDTLLPMITPEAESGDNSLLGNFLAPLKSKFTTDSIMNNQNVSDFYDKMDELTANARASTATNEDVLMNKYMNAVNKDLSDLYAKKREIQNSGLPDDEKYAQVRAVQEQIVNLARNGLNTYEQVDIKGEYATVGDKYFKLNKDGEWVKLDADEEAKYKATSAAGNSKYATDGTNHYRWYVPEGKTEGEWRKITDEQLEKQNKVTNGLGISASDYWSDKEEYDYAYEHPEKYAVAKVVGGYDAYKHYSSELYDIKADKDEDGKSISGSRKEKVIDYINNMNADYGEKIILFKSEYPADDTYNYDIIDYLNSRDDISYEEMNTILKELGFTIEADGVTITWD